MKVVGIVSGGLDSICYAAYIKKLKFVVESELHVLSFNYGQKGSKELEAANEVLEGIANSWKVLDISFMKQLWIGTQLTDDTVKVENSYTPSVVVPIRNMVFLTIGLAYALSIDAEYILYGSHLGDVGTTPDGEFLYPDCHPYAAKAIETAARISHFRKATQVKILSPGIEELTKVENLKLGYKAIGDKIFKTWSCYNSLEKQCGICESCNNRKEAFKIAGLKDLTEYMK